VNTKQLKLKAKAALKGNWKFGIFAFFITWVVSSVFDVPEFVPEGHLQSVWNLLVTALIVGPFTTGIHWFFLDIWDEKTLMYRNIMDFTRHYLKVAAVTFLAYAATVIGMLLLVFPGIWMALSLSQAIYLLKDDPQRGIVQCLKESYDAMKGERLRLFKLYLSFWPFVAIPVGLVLIAFLAFPASQVGGFLILLTIAYITLIGFYLIPFFSTARAGFYREAIDRKPLHSK